MARGNRGGLRPPFGSAARKAQQRAAFIAAPPTLIPVNSALPAITGTAQEGQILTVSNGTWSGSPTGYAYQWKRAGVAITGSINSTRTLTAADIGAVMTCMVTATNAGGSAAATSAATSAVIAAAVPIPVNSVAPAVTGTATVGSVLSSTTGTWSNSPTAYAYQWRRAGVDISGATASTYTLVSADGGSAVTCRVIATNAGGSAGATSNSVSVASSAPSITFDAPVSRSGQAYTFTARRSGSTAAAYTGSYALAPSTLYAPAAKSADVSGLTGALNFPAGAATTQVTVTVPTSIQPE